MTEDDRNAAGTKPGRSYQDFLNNQQQWVGIGHPPYKGMQARQIAEYELQRLNDLVAALKALEFAPAIRIFGSAVNAGVVPGDIDCFMKTAAPHPDDRLMALAKQFWPLLDPWVLTSDRKLFCKSESSSARNIGWTNAKHGAKMMLAAAQAGIPLVAFNPHYALPEDVGDPPLKVVRDFDAEWQETLRKRRLANKSKPGAVI